MGECNMKDQAGRLTLLIPQTNISTQEQRKQIRDEFVRRLNELQPLELPEGIKQLHLDIREHNMLMNYDHFASVEVVKMAVERIHQLRLKIMDFIINNYK